MSDKEMTTDQQLSIEYRRKFEFFLIGLIFATLAASINSFEMSGPLTAIIEIIAWLLLFIAGISGLSRVERLHRMYHHAHMLFSMRDSAKSENRSADDSELSNKVKSLANQVTRRYKVMWWLFLIGFTFLSAARIIPIILDLLSNITL